MFKGFEVVLAGVIWLNQFAVGHAQFPIWTMCPFEMHDSGIQLGSWAAMSSNAIQIQKSIDSVWTVSGNHLQVSSYRSASIIGRRKLRLGDELFLELGMGLDGQSWLNNGQKSVLRPTSQLHARFDFVRSQWVECWWGFTPYGLRHRQQPRDEIMFRCNWGQNRPSGYWLGTLMNSIQGFAAIIQGAHRLHDGIWVGFQHRFVARTSGLLGEAQLNKGRMQLALLKRLSSDGFMIEFRWIKTNE